MHYNWKVYMKQQCPKCGWLLARKRSEITEDSPSLCCRCKIPMTDVTPPKELLMIDNVERLRSLFPNLDLDTCIHYGCISQNSLDPDVLYNLIDESTDMIYENALQEFKDALENAVQEVLDDAYVEHVTAEDINFDKLVDEWNELYMNDYHQWYFKDEEYELDFDDDMNSITILKSPYYTYCGPCSPCVPNAGDLDCPVTLSAYEADKHISMLTSLKKAYCFPAEFFEKDIAPYKYFEVEKNE